MAQSSFENIKRLNEFGYGFKDGVLHQWEDGKATDKKFEFNIYPEHAKNQKKYEELGNLITDCVYDLLEEKGLHKIKVPLDAEGDSGTFIFSTQKELKEPKKLLILIHGSGVVRAGQWARSLIINHSIDAGTQIPYIEEAKKQGFEVILTNTNDNYSEEGPIKKSSSPTEHARYVWENIVLPSSPGAVAIVAHSYGGVVTMDLANKFPGFFKEKVFAIAFTDSVGNRAPESIRSHINDITVNWAASSEPLNKILKPASSSSVEFRSANHSKHEFTSFSSHSAIFEFLDTRFEAFADQQTTAKKPKLDDEL